MLLGVIGRQSELRLDLLSHFVQVVTLIFSRNRVDQPGGGSERGEILRLGEPAV